MSLFILTTILTNLMTLISFSPHYPQAQPLSCWPHWPSWRWFSTSRTTSLQPDNYTDPTETQTGLHRIIEDLLTKLIRSKSFKRIFYSNSFWDQEKLLEQIFLLNKMFWTTFYLEAKFYFNLPFSYLKYWIAVLSLHLKGSPEGLSLHLKCTRWDPKFFRLIFLSLNLDCVEK